MDPESPLAIAVLVGQYHRAVCGCAGCATRQTHPQVKYICSETSA
jgi:hypothetical protein